MNLGDVLFVVLLWPAWMILAALGALGDVVFGVDRMRRWGLRP